MNEGGVTGNDSPTPGNLFDEFEQAFQNCLAPLTKEDPLNGINFEELLTNAEANSQRFVDLAHRMEAAFLQKRFLLSVQKPELLIMEENHEMRVEMGRKDELIKKQTEKLSEWQSTLVNLINRVGSVPPAAAARNLNPAPPMPPHSISHGPITPGSASPAGLSPVGGAHPPNPLGMGGQMNHGVNLSPHGINTSIPMTSVAHQNMINQHPSSAAPTMPSGGQATFQPMNTMGNQGPPIHSGPMGMGMQPQSGGHPPNVGGSMFPGGMGPTQGNVQRSPMGMSQGGLQGPLAYLEKTTTNIGMPESRR